MPRRRLQGKHGSEELGLCGKGEAPNYTSCHIEKKEEYKHHMGRYLIWCLSGLEVS